MSRAKVFTSILMALILIALSGVSVWAAPGGQGEEPEQPPEEVPTVISGVVEGIEIVTEVDEETGETITTVLVTLALVDETTNEPTGETQTVSLSLATAIDLGLVPENIEQPVQIDPGDGTDPISGVVEGIEIVTEVDEETGETITTVLVTLALVDETTNEPTGETQTVSLSLATAIDLGLVPENIEQPVEIPEDVIEEDEEEGEEPTEHPVASALGKFFVEYLPEFFADTLELDYDTIMGYHEDGIGFGVIAQACWMSSMLYDSEAEDNITPGDILDAKKAHDFDSITLSEDGDPIITLPNGEVPTNWGQFRKAVLGSEKGQKNLGAIMSGRAAGEQEQEEEEEEEDVVVGSSTELSGKGKDKGGKPDIPPGQVKDKDKGGGSPAEPPGQVKNKDKGKGGGKKK